MGHGKLNWTTSLDTICAWRILSSPLLSAAGQQVFFLWSCSRSREWSLWVRHPAGGRSRPAKCHPGGPTQPHHLLHLLSRGQLFPQHCAWRKCQIWCRTAGLTHFCLYCLTPGNLWLHWQFEDGVWYAEQSVCRGPGQCSLSTGDRTGVYCRLNHLCTVCINLHRLPEFKDLRTILAAILYPSFRYSVDTIWLVLKRY